MKRIRISSLGLFAALTFVGINAYASDPGAVKINILGTSQALNGQASYSTNITSTSTNFTSESKYTTSNSVFNNTKLLQMLANSFNTNFPAGSALKLSDGGDFVVINGTNLDFDVSSVFSLSTSNNSIVSGTMISKEELTRKGTTGSSSVAGTISSVATLSYDDSTRTTGDGSTTKFNIPGVEDTHISMVNTGSSESFSLAMDFTGGGSGYITNSVSTNYYVLRATAVGAVATKFNEAP